ncbi:unnamed protein product [Phaeothamnion confervicola]
MHPFLQQRELLAYCREHGIVLEAYSSLGRGTDKLMAHPAVAAAALAHGRTPAQVLLRWALQRGVPVIPKSVNPERIRENAALDGFELSAAEMEALAALDRGERYCWNPENVTH